MALFYEVFLSTDSIHLKDDIKLHWCTLLCLILGDKGQIANFGKNWSRSSNVYQRKT